MRKFEGLQAPMGVDMYQTEAKVKIEMVEESRCWQELRERFERNMNGQ